MKQNIFLALIICISLLFTSCGNTVEPIETSGIILTTADNIQIAATYEQGNNKKAVILLHMLGNDRTSYSELTAYLNYNGYSILAPDFRGHGESQLDDTTFSDEDWQGLILDVQTSVDYLEAQGYEQIAVVGASIGANAALNYAVQDSRIDMGIFLSAGEEYKGINSIDVAHYYTKPGFFIASYEDKDAAIAATRLHNAISTDAKEVKLLNAGHGTEMLGKLVGLDILTWLDNNY
jgi:esterase/lipase